MALGKDAVRLACSSSVLALAMAFSKCLVSCGVGINKPHTADGEAVTASPLAPRSWERRLSNVADVAVC